MILFYLIAIPFIVGVLVLIAENWNVFLVRWITLVALLIDFGLSLSLWTFHSQNRVENLAQVNWNWIPQWGIRFHLMMDGLSLILVSLTLFLGILSVIASWKRVKQSGFFHFNLLWILSGILGVFLAADLFLFYFFWELMLVPMVLLIAIWGHENRVYAAIKFFLFTQVSGLLMLISILALYFIHGQATGIYTFDFQQLINTPIPPSISIWLMLGFFLAFAVKLPVVPLHTWLPDAHTEAPTAGSVILAGLLLKTGGYGLIRFVIPLFPDASQKLTPLVMILAIVGILYGGILACVQKDLKRLIAYTSISHLGFVLLGVFSKTELGLQGAILQMVCHGLSTGGLFILSGSIQSRIHTREIDQMGGLWSIAPKMSGFGMFFALASLGLPGIGNFIGEFLVLIGTFQVSPIFGVLGSLGFIISTIYSLWIVQSVFHGSRKKLFSVQIFPDFSVEETCTLAALAIALVWIGVYPQAIIHAATLRATPGQESRLPEMKVRDAQH